MPGAPVSVIVPVYGNQDTLEELHGRIATALAPTPIEFIYVDDAGPDDSRRVLARLAEKDPRVRVIQMAANVGQHAAVLVGLAHATGHQVAVLDADLQDPPEVLPELFRRLGDGYEAVFGGRTGSYESLPRLVASRGFKLLLTAVAGVPTDAGLFVAMSRDMVQRVVEYPPSQPHVVAMIGHSRLPMLSVPVVRLERPSGASEYSFTARLRLAFRGLTWRIRFARSARGPVHTALPPHTVIEPPRPQSGAQ